MNFAVGQRWRYKDSLFEFVVEIKKLRKLENMITGEGQVIQKFSGSYEIGRPQSIDLNRLVTTNDILYTSLDYNSASAYEPCGYSWEYLMNQDKPNN